jgi:hypothetical protein
MSQQRDSEQQLNRFGQVKQEQRDSQTEFLPKKGTTIDMIVKSK